MKVEVLYVGDCPSHAPAVKLVRRILAAQGVEEEIHEVLVRDQAMARQLKFRGSPTIRINGRDVAEGSQIEANFALNCRLYLGSKQKGLPPAELIHQAVAEARRGERS